MTEIAKVPKGSGLCSRGALFDFQKNGKYYACIYMYKYIINYENHIRYTQEAHG